MKGDQNVIKKTTFFNASHTNMEWTRVKNLLYVHNEEAYGMGKLIQKALEDLVFIGTQENWDKMAGGHTELVSVLQGNETKTFRISL